jgi:hypothetical protein
LEGQREEEGDYVSGEKGDKKPSGDNLEKRPISNSSDMSEMWDKDVSNDESLKMLSTVTLHDFLE